MLTGRGGREERWRDKSDIKGSGYCAARGFVQSMLAARKKNKNQARELSQFLFTLPL